MHVSGEGKIGLGFAFLLALGTGAVMVLPDTQKLIGWAMIGFGAAGLIWLAGNHIHERWAFRELSRRWFWMGSAELKRAHQRDRSSREIFDLNDQLHQLSSDVESVALGSLIPAPPPPGTPSTHFAEPWEAALEYGRLFEIDVTNKRIKILFCSDGSDKAADSLLLALFAHKKFFQQSMVSYAVATAAMYSAPVPTPLGPAVLHTLFNAPDSHDIARDKLGRRVKIVGLSQGGFLEITEDGYAAAYWLAKDMIERA